MRLAFVYPPQEACPAFFPKRVAAQDSREGQVLPPLGIAYLAAILEKSHKVKILDVNALRMDQNEVIGHLRLFRPDILMFSLVSTNFQSNLRWIKEIKKEIQVPVIVGGIQATFYPKEILTYECIDVCVIGDAWETLPELVGRMEEHSDLKEVNGIAYKINGDILTTAARQSAVNIDDVPFPARNLLPNEKYTTILSKRRPITAMMSSTGCPFHCIHCSSGHKVIFRNPFKVVDEMDECVHKYGIKEILFYDEIFSLDKGRVRVICEEILRRKLDVKWTIRTSANLVDEDLIMLFAKAGCIRINYGVESAEPIILDRLRKNISLEAVRNAVRWTKKFKIDALGFFMLGSPGETLGSIRKTIQFAKDLNFDFVQFTKVAPLPHTELYGMMQEATGKDFWREYTLGKEDLNNLMSIGTQVTLDELNFWIKKAYQDFYFRPGYILKTLMKVNSYAELRHLMHSAWSLR